MKKTISILFLFIGLIAFGQTGPATVVNGKVTYNYRPTTTTNTLTATVNPSTFQLEFKEVPTIVLATPSVAGIAKMYTATGANADGSMTQQAITNALQAVENTTAISQWSAGTYANDIKVYRTINNQTYVFRSMTSGNTTEPLLYKYVDAWTAPPLGGTWVGAWSGSGTAGGIYTQEGFAYYCLTTNTTSPKTLTAPDWVKLGQYRGVFDGVTKYNNGDIVTNGSNVVFQSQTDLNGYALNYGKISNWQVLTQDSFTIYCWGDSLTRGTGSTGESDYTSYLSTLTGYNFVNKGVPGETSTQIKTRFDAEPATYKYGVIFWVGRNNYSDPTTVLADIAAMVAKLPHTNYLIVGIIKAHGEGCCPVEDLNTSLAAAYPGRFVALQDYLVESYDSGQPQDVADHADGKLPWSLLSDWLHLNNKGYKLVAQRLAERMNYLRQNENAKFGSLQASALQVSEMSGSSLRPIEAVEFFYSAGEGYINSKDRKTLTNKPLTIQNDSGSTLNLLKNSGILKTGDLGVQTSETIQRIGRDTSTGRFLQLPSLTTGYIPLQLSNGNFGNSLIYSSGSQIGINTGTDFESGYITQINTNLTVGTKGQARAYYATVAPTKWLFQVRDETSEQDAWLTANRWLFGSGSDDGSGAKYQFNGGDASFSGKVKMAAPSASADGVNKGYLEAYSAKTSNYILTGSDGVIDFTSGSSTATLPTAVGATGKRYIIKNTGTGATSIATTSSQTIDGNSGMVLFNQYSSVILVSDGANWKIVDTYNTTSSLNTSLTATQTAATLNAAYPNAWPPFVVYAPSVTTGPMVFIKTTTGGQWMQYSGSLLNP